MTNPNLKVVITLDGKEYTAGLENATRSTDQFGGVADVSASRLSHFTGSLKAAAAAAATYISIGMVKELVNQADAYRTLQTRIRTATKETGDYVEVSRRLGEITGDNGIALEHTVGLFQSLARIAPELQASNGEILTLTNLVQQLGVISGASQSSLSAGLLQFSQGLAAGVFRAEEMNSILENIPEVAVRIAKGLGLSVGELRGAVLEGTVLSKDVFDALLKQAPEIASEFSNIPISVARASTAVEESMDRIVAAIDTAANGTSSWASILETIAEHNNRIADYISESELQTLQRQRAMLINQLQQPDTWYRFTTDATKQAALEAIDALDQQIIAINKRMLATESAEDYGKRMAQIARTAYPEAVASQPKKKKKDEVPEIPDRSKMPAEFRDHISDEMAMIEELTASYERYAQAKESVDVVAPDNSAYIARLAEAERVTLSLRTATEVYSDEMIRLNAQWQDGDISTETYVRGLDRAQDGLTKFGETGTAVFDGLKSAAEGWSRDFADRLLDNERGFAGFVDAMIRQIARIAIAKSTEPMFDAIATGIGGMFTPTKTQAQGGVWDSGRVLPFARGGIVSEPTTFPMRSGVGLMGEAGPESIMPLKRMNNGDLGIQASTAAPRVTTNVIINNAPSQPRVSERENSTGGRDIRIEFDELAAGLVSGGGRFDKALQRTYGVRRAV